MLQPAQLHAADFSGDRLRQFGHQLDLPDALERRKARVQVLEDRERGFRRALDACRAQDIGLGDREPDRIGARHDGGLRHRLMLDQHAFELERADAVVGRLEHVVGAADEGEIAVVVDEHHVAAAIVIAVGARQLAVVALIALHQAGRTVGAEHQRHLALFRRMPVGILDDDAIARQRPAHRADLDLLPRRDCRQAPWSRSGRNRRGW